MNKNNFDPPLDKGIERAVVTLCEAGVDTFESCEGGKGHAYPEPTVRFRGSDRDAQKALDAAMSQRLPVAELRKTWPMIDGRRTGPWWEMTFVSISQPD